jgi:small subunit ribosomal protein S17e
MGRIKTSFIKRVAQDLFDARVEEFSTDFNKNKETVDKLASFESNRMRNVVAGYITRLKKRSMK